MSQNTKIEWADHTFNPWIGCTRISPACDHCYAARIDHRFGGGHWGAGAPRKRTSPANWAQPLRWNRQAAERGVRYRVFCASLADVFDNEVPVEWRLDLFDLIRATPNLDWLLLTKRVGAVMARIDEAAYEAHMRDRHELRDWIFSWCIEGKPPGNVWLGDTVVNQDEADRDVPKLLATPAAVRFLSIEPMLGPIELRRVRCPPDRNDPDQIAWKFDALSTGSSVEFYNDGYWCDGDGPERATAIDWVIAGGESGPRARPSHPDWFRSLRDQCVDAEVPFLFKQWGEWAPWRCSGFGDHRALGEGNGPWPYGQGKFADWVLPIEGISPPDFAPFMSYPGGVPTGCTVAARLGKKAAGRELDGRTWDEVPT